MNIKDFRRDFIQSVLEKLERKKDEGYKKKRLKIGRAHV